MQNAEWRFGTPHAARRTPHSLCRGQIATLLMLFMALGLMFMMVSVNVGKVAMTRTHTSNAADAGALAAVSWLASADNCIKTLSNDMFLAYTAWVAAQAATFYDPYLDPWTGFAWQMAFEAGQLTAFVLPGISAGIDASKLAGAYAKQYAFNNSGVDDPNLQGGDPDENNFQEFLQAEGQKITGTVGCGITNLLPAVEAEFASFYGWQDSRGFNEFTVEASGAPTPEPIHTEGPVVYWACNPGEGDWKAGPLCCHPSGENFITCHTPYPFPVWVASFIAAIEDDEGEVQVTTTRVEAGGDQRLWQMRYDDPDAPGEGITSSATGWYGGGSPLPFSGEDYEAKLVAVQ